MPTLTEIREKIHAKQDALAGLFEKHRNSAGEYTHGGEDIGEVRRRSQDLDRETKELEGLLDAAKEAERFEAAALANEAAIKARRDGNGGAGTPKRLGFDGSGGGGGEAPHVEVQRMMNLGFMPQMPAMKSLGELFVEDAGYKSMKEGAGVRYGMTESPIRLGDALAIKATLATGTLTSYNRPPGIVTLGQQIPLVADLIANGETQSPTIRYMRENSYSNAATSVAEGGLKPEATWDLAEVDAPVRKIAVTSKLTEEILADFTMVRDYVNQRGPFMVAQQLDTQILNGNGTAPNLRGILQTSGIQTQPKGSDPGPDAIYKAMVKVRSIGFFEPDGVVMNWLDWQNIRLLRTTDGLYIWGSPADPGPERIWGKPVVQTTAIAAGTALVGSYQLGAMLFMRTGITTEMTNANEDDFKRNLIAIRWEVRAGLAVWRPLAFATVTGL